MTTNRQEQIKWLATRVMDWRISGQGKYLLDLDRPEWQLLYSSDFDPFNNAGQALDLLDKFDSWEIFTEGDVKLVTVYRDDDDETAIQVYAREEADGEILTSICLACLRASGWEGELG